jgi:hemerythrin-like domain-containing protein
MHERPTDQLRREHELVLLVVEAMECEATDIERTGMVHRERIARMIDFARNFTDGCHHQKEEEALFPALLRRSEAAAAAVSVMLSEHAAGRDMIYAIDEALPRAGTDAAARAKVAVNLAFYARLLHGHIAKENNVLFSLAEYALSPREQSILAKEFAWIEEEEIGPAAHGRFDALARDLVRPPLAA